MAWQIAADAGLITRVECDRLVELQLRAIDQALELGACPRDTREMLTEMKTGYWNHLQVRWANV